ncbi:MAG: hypothetical protein ABSG37_14020 [Candidatus Limnocylindrales bacterium]|jgi:hypothetical protein
MPKLEQRVLQVLTAATGAQIEAQTAPDWLIRPGRTECGELWPTIRAIYAALTHDQDLPDVMPTRERRRVDGVLRFAGRPAQIVEVDESQHFNEFRAATLNRYPEDIRLGFPIERWLAASRAKRKLETSGFARPCPPLFGMMNGRHRQRAFRDALADLLPDAHGFGPTIRIADFEVEDWIWSPDAPDRLRVLIEDRVERPLQPSPRQSEGAAPALTGGAIDPIDPCVTTLVRTQRVTATDLRAGRIRLPASAKVHFPAVRGVAEIVLRDSPMTVRYDPRNRPVRARSAVLSIGRTVLTAIVIEGEALIVSSRDGVARLD